MATKNVDPFATPLHIQRLEQSLRLEPLLNYIENVINHANDSELETSGTDGELDMDPDKPSVLDEDGNRIYNGIVVSKAERKADKNRLYNFGKVKKSRKWLKNVLLSDSSSGEEEQTSQDDINNLLEIHNYQKTCRKDFHKDEELHQYKYFSTGLLSSHDKFHEHQKSILGPKKKLAKEQKKLEKKLKKAKLKKLKQEQPTTFPGSSNSSFPEHYDGDEEREDGELTYEELRLQQMLYGEHQPLAMFHNVANQPTTAKTPKNRRLTQEQLAAKRRRVWVAMCKKEIPKAAKQKAAIRKEGLSNLKKVGKECQKEYRRSALVSQKLLKEGQVRARRLAKEAQAYWKRFEKVEKEHRKKAEKEAIEQRKVDLEVQEMKRQQRKLNFLITQTELYAHFMAKKLTGESEEKKEAILSRLDDEDAGSHKTAEVSGGALTNVGGLDNYNPKDAKDKVLKTADTAYRKHKQKTELFDATINKKAPSSIFADPSLSVDNIPQPSVLQCKLKGYQVKGLNWLASLYNQGINGILADEMGLGKTVQSISFLAHLAESHGIWGPFLVVAPASTLHNWQQELTKFMPTFKVVPYWGNTQDRKVLRKFFSSDQPFHSKEASFHVAITSYQLIIQDAKYFHRIKWHYMVLDEAQAIKSVSSVRWKMLLGFNCRNRLLLTGTPIQNSMQELWALLHYIMPTLFDSHEEFNDWFSKDIESHAERQSGIDEKHLSRLHMILKPFMLRRCKKDVENELSDKIEVIVYCPLTKRQRYLYQAIKNKIRIEDLLSSTTGQMQGSSSLMNLVMQFRKVCNHPELFERREVRSPMYVKLDPYLVPKLVYREALLDKQIPSKNHLLLNKLHIFNPHHIHTSLSETSSTSGTSCFAFSRFCDLSVGELSAIMLLGLLARWKHLFKLNTVEQILHHRHTYAEVKLPSRCIGREGFLLQPLRTISFPNLRSRRVSPVLLPPLVFTTSAASVHCHGNVTLHCMKETAAHRKIRNRRRSGKDAAASLVVAGGDMPTSPPLGECKSPTGMRAGAAGVMPAGRKPPTSPTKASKLASLAAMDESLHPHIPRPPQVLEMMPLEVPNFLYKVMPKTQSPYLEAYSIDRSSAWDSYRVKLCGTLEAKQSLLYGSPQHLAMARRSFFSPSPLQGLGGIRPKYGYSGVSVPDKETMVTDAGKLYVLDSLLGRLKQEGHRVLIYSQMTRMIDLLEEYMWHRRHTYMRLDGSSKISDRRDMVNDFQSRSDIFVFLLSTRAGGLGINLTAADTVIFYDSDWNPTVDQQAMDRAHRLGQTKQVTVYRLICKGTIEERIIQRAQEKSEIQKMVIEGGDVRPDVLRPKEVVSLLLDDEEIEKKLKKKQEDEGYIDFGHTVKRKKSGRGPGRPPKKKKLEEEAVQNQTIPAVPPPSTPSFFDMDPASPMSGISESTQQSLATATAADDSSNDGLVIVDDAHTTFPPVTSPATPSSSTGKRGRPRGRPRGSGGGRGSGTPRRSRGRGSVQKAIMAAESAAVRAGKTAAFAAYGYNFQSDPSSPLVPGRGGASPRGRGRGVAMRGRGIGRPPQT